MIELLLKSSFAIGMAFLFYKLFLQQESFFGTNRLYLLGCLVLAFALPFISLPKLVDQQGYLSGLINKSFSEEEALKTTFSTPLPESSPDPFASPFVPETVMSNSIPEEVGETAMSNPVKRASEINIVPQENTNADKPLLPVMSLQSWLLLIYFFGMAVFFLSLLFQLGCVFFEIIRSREKTYDGKYIIVNTASPKAPCSFLNYIFIYPDDYDFETYEQIIKHEKIHVRLGHSFDLLLAELAVIVLWFNPFIWWFKKEIEKNNEYQTDALLLEKEQVRKDKYQLNLLQIAVPNKALNITTYYNQSLIKQRIIMMNSKRSTPHAYWKYSFLAPLFFGMLLLMNEPATGQEKEKVQTQKSDTSATSGNESVNRAVEIRREMNEERRQAVQEERQNLSAVRAQNIHARQEIRENQVAARAESIRIRAEVRENQIPARAESIRTREVLRGTRAAARAERAQTIERVRKDLRGGSSTSYIIHNGQVDMTKGVWYSSVKNGKYCIEFRSSTDDNKWMMSDCFERSAFQKKQDGQFVMTREAGSLQLNGNLDAEVGQGKYVFNEDAGFQKLLNDKNISGENQNLMFHLFLGDVTKEYVNFLSKEYPDLDADDLRNLAIHGIKMADFKGYIDLYNKYNGNKPSIDEIVSARIHGINEAYVAELQKAGFSDLSMKKMKEAKIHGISASYVNDLRNAGFSNLSINEVISAKIHGVNPSSVKEMRALGAEDLDKIIQLQIHNVDAAYVKDLQAAGLGDLSLDQIVTAKIHGLNPASIQEIRDLGFENLRYNDILTARIHGVDQAFVKDLQKAGFSGLSMNKVVSAKIHGIDSGFIEESRKNGYDLNSIDKYISLKIHGGAMESLKEK